LRDRVSSLLLQQHYSKREANRKPTAATAATKVTTIRNKLEPVSPEEADAKPVTPAEQLNKLYPLQTSLKYVADEMPLSFAAQRAVFLEVCGIEICSSHLSPDSPILCIADTKAHAWLGSRHGVGFWRRSWHVPVGCTRCLAFRFQVRRHSHVHCG
jgi:hypothetical protein